MSAAVHDPGERRGRTAARWRRAVAGVAVAIALFGLLFFAAFGGDQDQRPDEWLAIELHMRVAEDVTHFRIPRGYLTTPSNLRGGEQEVLQIEAAMPALEPWKLVGRARSPVDVGDEFLASMDDPVRLRVLVLPGRPFAKRIRRERIIASTLEAEFDRFGLSSRIFIPEYPEQFSNGYVRSTAIYYLPGVGYSNDSQFFECFTGVLKGDCRGHGNYNEQLYYQYYFAEESFAYWRDLDEGVVALLREFEEAAYTPDSR